MDWVEVALIRIRRVWFRSGIIRNVGARNCRMGKRWSWRLAKVEFCRGMGFDLGVIRLLRVFGIRDRGFCWSGWMNRWMIIGDLWGGGMGEFKK